MTIPEDVINILIYWVFLEGFYFIVLLPTTLNGGWKNYDWELFLGMTIITPIVVLVVYLLSCLLDILIP